jgi:phosphoribosylaminoimidazolecarboxamide formyltransferase/IMP cyclohydrolase
MEQKNFSAMYKTMNKEDFPSKMEISFYDTADDRQTLYFEKVTWNIDGQNLGLRYGENPDQGAAFYKLINGNLSLGGVENILPGRYLLSDAELLQSGKHPGKINITDVDAALNIMRYMTQKCCCAIIKHNNPCGVALGSSLQEAFHKAYYADRIAAFGGAIVFNRTLDKATAALVAAEYFEVVAAPEFDPGVMEIFAAKKNLRVMRIKNIGALQNFETVRFLEPKALIDGSLITQWSFLPSARQTTALLPAVCVYKEKEYRINRNATEKEKQDMIFGWLVEAGVTSNSVLYVKDEVTVGIGTGEQDRVGVAEIARDKAYRKLADRICFEKTGEPLAVCSDPKIVARCNEESAAQNGGIRGSVMVSDAFFPFRDGVDAGIREGITAVVQPGGSIRDWEVIDACNEKNVAMMFTGQRSFRH